MKKELKQLYLNVMVYIGHKLGKYDKPKESIIGKAKYSEPSFSTGEANSLASAFLSFGCGAAGVLGNLGELSNINQLNCANEQKRTQKQALAAQMDIMKRQNELGISQLSSLSKKAKKKKYANMTINKDGLFEQNF